MKSQYKTVYERSLENGGYIAGPDHPLTRRLAMEPPPKKKKTEAVERPRKGS